MRLLLVLLAACGSSTHTPGPDAHADGGEPQPLGPLMPQERAANPSAVMATPTVVAITYDGDPNRADTEAFFAQYAESPAWAMHVGEYGVGALKVGTPHHLAGAAATSDAAVRQILSANLTGASPAW